MQALGIRARADLAGLVCAHPFLAHRWVHRRALPSPRLAWSVSGLGSAVRMADVKVPLAHKMSDKSERWVGFGNCRPAPTARWNVASALCLRAAESSLLSHLTVIHPFQRMTRPRPTDRCFLTCPGRSACLSMTWMVASVCQR